MFYLGLVVVLLLVLELALSVQRLLRFRQSSNAEVLSDMINALDNPAPAEHTPDRATPLRYS